MWYRLLNGSSLQIKYVQTRREREVICGKSRYSFYSNILDSWKTQVGIAAAGKGKRALQITFEARKLKHP